MSFIPCSACGHRNVGRLTHVYWFSPNHGEAAFRVRQRLCSGCLAERVTSWLSPEDAETLTCPACGISVEDQVFAVYVTYYEDPQQASRGAMSLCEQHYIHCINGATEGAMTLPDRYLEEPDRALTVPRPSADEVLHSMGRVGRKLSPVQRERVANHLEQTYQKPQ
jgi:hypothetical protein